MHDNLKEPESLIYILLHQVWNLLIIKKSQTKIPYTSFTETPCNKLYFSWENFCFKKNQINSKHFIVNDKVEKEW